MFLVTAKPKLVCSQCGCPFVSSKNSLCYRCAEQELTEEEEIYDETLDSYEEWDICNQYYDGR